MSRACLVIGSLLIAVPAFAGAPVRFAGAVGGLVLDPVGKPQPGAMVSLLNQQEQLLQRSYTDISGNFAFSELLPDLYSIRVSVPAFMTASRDKLLVRAGMRSLLEINLSKMFSSIQVVSTVPAAGGLMSEDWKWTLRADPGLRPVLRLQPVTTASAGTRTAVFHDSSAMVRISAKETSISDAAADQSDLGTQFAFATSFYSNNQVSVAGDLGLGAATGQPAAAIRTTYKRQVAGSTPEISLTMRQMNASLRTLSVSLQDKARLTDLVTLEYGSELDTVSFVDHLQYFSPWAKLSYALSRGRLEADFNSGNARPEAAEAGDRNSDLIGELAALSMMPRLSEINGRVKAQRGDNYELAIVENAGGIEFRLSGYHQHISDTALTVAHPDQGLLGGDLLPSLFSRSAQFDAAGVSYSGYTVSATRDLSWRRLGGDYNMTIAYGTTGVLSPQGMTAISDAGTLRSALASANRQAVTIRSAGAVRKLGTRYVASYQHADLQGAVPLASYSTQADRSQPGLNIVIRQPIASLPTISGRVEATAEMRNALAQGYLPIGLSDGRQILVVNAPRVFRGGLAFVF